MYSIRNKIGIILVSCSICALTLAAVFVNFAVNSTFNKYMSNIQDKRNQRIVSYFEEVYKSDSNWTANSGIEIMHEAYMSNYCLTLYDSNRKVIWTMNPENIKFTNHYMNMNKQDQGVYVINTFEINSGNKVVGYVDIGQYSSVLMSEEDINFKLSINKSIVLSVILTMLIAVLLGLYFSKQFSTPISKVSGTTEQLSKGNYDARPDVKSDILEINSLIGSINILGEKLKKQDMLRKRLVSDISHEIRAPLNILQNNLEAMVDGVYDVTSERLTSLNEEVVRFGKLLDNLNVLKEFDAEEVELNMEPLSLDKLIYSVSKDFEINMRNKGIDFTLSYNKDGSYAVIGDGDSLRQVFINLLSNAIKFTPDGGRIWVDIIKDKTHITVKISDSGMGIEREDLPYVYERLYRGDKSRNVVEGSGIGLTIVKKILMLHGASIDVESEINKGTVFTIRFKTPH